MSKQIAVLFLSKSVHILEAGNLLTRPMVDIELPCNLAATNETIEEYSFREQVINPLKAYRSPMIEIAFDLSVTKQNAKEVEKLLMSHNLEIQDFNYELHNLVVYLANCILQDTNVYPAIVEQQGQSLMMYLLEHNQGYYRFTQRFCIPDFFEDKERVCFELVYQKYKEASRAAGALKDKDKEILFEKAKRDGKIDDWIKFFQQKDQFNQNVTVVKGVSTSIFLESQKFDFQCIKREYRGLVTFKQYLERKLKKKTNLDKLPIHPILIGTKNRELVSYFRDIRGADNYHLYQDHDDVIRTTLQAMLDNPIREKLVNDDPTEVTQDEPPESEKKENKPDDKDSGEGGDDKPPFPSIKDLWKIVGIVLLCFLLILGIRYLSDPGRQPKPTELPLSASSLLGNFSGTLQLKDAESASIILRLTPKDTTQIPCLFHFEYELNNRLISGEMKLYPKQKNVKFDDKYLIQGQVVKRKAYVSIHDGNRLRLTN